MDLTSVAVISMFAAALAGGLLGLVVGRLTRFELGLAAGLAIFGGVVLWFAGRCYLEYQAFAHAGANGLWGEVVEIAQIPIGESGTQPAPIVRFTAPDNAVHTVQGPRASSARVGEHVNVIYDPIDPQRSRIGQIGEARGCAIAMMLFGTFPMSFALFMLVSVVADRAAHPPDPTGGHPRMRARERTTARRNTPAERHTRSAPRDSRIYTALSMALYFTMFGAIVWIGLGTDDLLRRFAQGFGIVAGALAGYAILVWFGGRASGVWAFGVIVLALNFAVWAWALHLLV